MIRNFIYLNEEKMYSLSSQLFEGITEYLLEESESTREDQESQKGRIGSGRVIGDILKRSDRTTEKKFLNDHSYTLFEEKLLSDAKAIQLPLGDEELNLQLRQKSFIKLTSKAVFNDINKVVLTLNRFNEIGHALAYVTNAAEIKSIKNEKSGGRSSTKRGKGQNDQNIQQVVKKLANDKGLQHEPDFIKNMNVLFDYGYQNQLEIQLSSGGKTISADLDRSLLREKEEYLIRKYSRLTEIEFTLFGIVTQFGDEKAAEEPINEGGDTEEASIKGATRNIVHALGTFESAFTGRLPNEIIVDPIAVYTQL